MRKVNIDKKIVKQLKKFDGKALGWQKAIIDYLKDESNTIEEIKEKFESTQGDLKEYYKAKNSSLKVRIIFEILETDEDINIFLFERDLEDDGASEILNIFAGGYRDKIYDEANRRAVQVRKDREKLKLALKKGTIESKRKKE